MHYHKPKNPELFTDSSDHWLRFREARFAAGVEGDYAVLKGLDLSGLKLHDFIVDHLAFVDCKLDRTSFSHTEISFKAAFINCSLRGVDFRDTAGADVLFYSSDLTGARFDRWHQWASVDLDGNTVQSFFVGTIMEDRLHNFLEKDGNYIMTIPSDKIQLPGAVRQALEEIGEAPVIDV